MKLEIGSEGMAITAETVVDTVYLEHVFGGNPSIMFDPNAKCQIRLIIKKTVKYATPTDAEATKPVILSKEENENPTANAGIKALIDQLDKDPGTPDRPGVIRL